MKKRLFVLLSVFTLCVCTVSACNKKQEDSDKNSVETEKKENSDAKKLADYKDVVEVLCDSKANNDLDEFLLNFDYMKGLMESVVTEEDAFAKVSENYKQECGEDFEWSYKITEANKIPEESLSQYQEIIQIFGGEGTLSQAYELIAEVEISGNKGKKEYTLEITVGKVEEKWQIVNFNDTLMQ